MKKVKVWFNLGDRITNGKVKGEIVYFSGFTREYVIVPDNLEGHSIYSIDEDIARYAV